MKEDIEMQKVTGNQPQVTDTRIYGSVPVEPIAGASNQPEVLPHVKPYGVKSIPTIRVTLKGGDKEMVINASDFDPGKHERLDV